MFYARLGANLFSRLPYSVQRHRNPAMQAMVDRIEQSHGVDLWHVEWTPYAENIREAVYSPWIVTAHNIETQIWQRYYENEHNPLKAWYIARQCRKLRRFEEDVFQSTNLLVTVSDHDAAIARDVFGARRTAVISNGVDPDFFRPGDGNRNPLEILFLGSLFWRPNLDAVSILLNEVFPRVVAQEPRARLAVVGQSPPAWLRRRIAALPWASLHASVRDVRPYLWRCGALVVPLRIGGGTRLKILEALSCECPVITTTIGAEGLDLQPDRHFVRADTAQLLARSILETMRDPEPIRPMAREGREAVVAQYSWNTIAQKLARVWDEEAASPRTCQ